MHNHLLSVRKTTGLLAAICCALLGLASQGCVTLPSNQNASKPGKQGKEDCCPGCEKDKITQKKTNAVYNMAPQTQVAQRKVLPEEINSGNYQKMLKSLEEEVDQSSIPQ